MFPSLPAWSNSCGGVAPAMPMPECQNAMSAIVRAALVAALLFPLYEWL